MTTPQAISLLAMASVACAGGAAGGASADAPVPASDPPRISYEPFSASYHAIAHGHVEQEFSGQVNASEFTMSYYLTAGVVSFAGVHRISLTVDSVPELRGAALTLSPGDKDRVRGTIFSGIVSPTGEIIDFRGGDTTIALVNTLADGLASFLPRLPKGGASAGDTWSDTTESTSSTSGIDVQVRSIRRHEAVGWTERAGERALHFMTVVNYTFSGSGTQMGQEFTLEGSGVRYENNYLGPGGRYLGATSADSSSSTALLTAIGISIPIRQTRTDTVRVLP